MIIYCSVTFSPAVAREIIAEDLAGDTEKIRLAAWTMVARVLLNLDEFITRE